MLGGKLRVVVIRVVRGGISRGGVPARLGDEPCVRQGRQTVTEAEGGVRSEKVRGTCAEPLGWTELCVTLGGTERTVIFLTFNFLLEYSQWTVVIDSGEQ